jgi:diguanylate cyclase (GGDEF)-like protein
LLCAETIGVNTSHDTVDVNELTAPPGELRRVTRYGLGLVLFALVLTPVASIVLGQSYPLFGMLQAASITVSAITALLLLVQARATGSLPTAVLGAGFTYAAATMMPYALLFPGMFPGLGTAIGASPTAYQYLWMLSRTGLIVALIAYQWLRLAERSYPTANTRGRLVIAGLTIAYIAFTPILIWLPALPPTIEGGHWSTFFIQFMVPLIVLIAGASALETFRSRRRANVLDAWVAIVAFGVIAETYLALAGVSRFTIGWYASRVVVLFATSAVLVVLLVQAGRLYADLIERAEVLLGEAHTDTLTELPNRRRFDEEFARAFGSAIRRSSPIGVAIIDIDHFKNYNDAFGHQAGDEALRRIAHAIAESVDRSGDFAARYGGEEFVVILEDTTLGGAAGVAERIRNAVLEAGIAAPSGGLLSVSVGVAARLPGSTGEALLRQADAALYDAKHDGRNRVSSWRSPESAPIGSAYDDVTLADQ